MPRCLRFVFLILSLLCAHPLFSQGRFSISGVLIDHESQPLIQASVRLLSPKDSTFVEGVVTNENGAFCVWAYPGDYILKASYIGFLPQTRNIHLPISRKSINVGPIRLHPDQIWLEGAVVSAKAQPVVVKEDTVVYNAAAYRVEEGATVDELIAKIPGAQIDAQGNVTLHGQQIKELYVNGQRFFGTQVKVGLKNLPADMVENIKAYEIPNEMSKISGVDDGESLPVLDLTIRKDKMNDWRATTHLAGGLSRDVKARYRTKANLTRIDEKRQVTIIAGVDNINQHASVTNTSRHFVGGGDQGLKHNREVGANLSGEGKKLKWGANLHYGGNNQDARYTRRNETIYYTGNTFSNVSGATFNRPDAIKFDGVLEWRPIRRMSISVKPNISYQYNERSSDISTQYYSATDSSRVNDNHALYQNYRGNTDASVAVSMWRGLKKSGRSFSVYLRARYLDTRVDDFTGSHIRYYKIKSNPDSTLIRNQHYNEQNANFYATLQLSYTEPITKKLHVQFLLREDITQTSRVRDFYNLPSTSLGWENVAFPAKDPLLSSRGGFLSFASHIQANIRYYHKKSTYVFGVICKPQNTRLDYYERGEKKTIYNHVLNFAPSISIKYLPSKTEKLSLVYASWAGAPSLARLVPVASGSNPNYVQYGNPYLKPSFTHRAIFTYNYSNPKRQNSFVSSLQWRMTENQSVTSTQYDPVTGGRTITYQNINGNWRMVGSVLYNETFRNSPFSLSANLSGEYVNDVSLLYNNQLREDVVNTIRRFMTKFSVDASYRNEWLELGLGVEGNYTHEASLLRPEMSRQPFCVTPSLSALFIFPFKVRLSSDISVMFQRGFRYADLDRNFYVWNLSLSYPVLRGKGSLRLQAYDVFNQLPDIVGTFSSTSRSISNYQASNSYILMSFIYRFAL